MGLLYCLNNDPRLTLNYLISRLKIVSDSKFSFECISMDKIFKKWEYSKTFESEVIIRIRYMYVKSDSL